ncbi:MAG: hypothetical protein AB7G93_22345 [Bdellovibrionales bacterium]
MKTVLVFLSLSMSLSSLLMLWTPAALSTTTSHGPASKRIEFAGCAYVLSEAGLYVPRDLPASVSTPPPARRTFSRHDRMPTVTEAAEQLSRFLSILKKRHIGFDTALTAITLGTLAKEPVLHAGRRVPTQQAPQR